MLEVALHEQLGLFALGGRGQGGHTEHARAHPFGQRLDDPALARRVPPFEDHDDAGAGGLHPLLQMAELDLQLLEALGIGLLAQLSARRSGLRRFHFREFDLLRLRLLLVLGVSLAVQLLGRGFGVIDLGHGVRFHPGCDHCSGVSFQPPPRAL